MSFLLRFKITGHSMEPFLKNGQEVLISSIPYLFRNPAKGDIIAFKNTNKFILKRIKEVQSGKYLMKGDNKKDSKDYGWIERNQIVGKVIYIHA